MPRRNVLRTIYGLSHNMGAITPSSRLPRDDLQGAFQVSIGLRVSYRVAGRVNGDRRVGDLMPRVIHPPDVARSSNACALRPFDALRSTKNFALASDAMDDDRAAPLVGATR